MTAELNDYDERFLTCREVGHAWPPPRTWTWKRLTSPTGRVVEYTRSMMCTRCNTIARDVIDATTGGSHRSMRYSDGYLRKGKVRVFKGEVRLERINRLAEDGAIETSQSIE